MKNEIQELYTLERLSNGNTCIHRLHPTVKLSVTLIFIIVVISFDRYSIFQMLPYIFYPLLMISLSEIPYTMLLKKFFFTLPFCLCLGVGNILFDMTWGGVISLFTIVFRTFLCVMAVLVLVCVTPLREITQAMRRLRLPGILVTIFEMTYRYIGILFDETTSMYNAYLLRGNGRRGVKITDMGSFVGQLLLRSFDRAERVYNAMKCRGYALFTLPKSQGKLTRRDLIFAAVTCFLFAAFRFINLNRFWTDILGGL